MKSIALLFITLIVIASPVYSQITFERRYGTSLDDAGFSACQTNDGGYIVTGYTNRSPNGIQAYLIKTDSFGDTLWTRNYGGSGWEMGISVCQTSDGGYIIGGYTSSYGAGNDDFYLIKTDAQGDTIWTRTFGGSALDYGYSVRQTIDKGYILTGYTRSFGNGTNLYLVKTDSLGSMVWTKNYGGPNDDYAYSVKQTMDGGYIIAGRTNSYGAGGVDVYLIKTGSTGDTVWTSTYGTADDEEGRSVCQTSDNGYIITGYQGTSLYLVKTGSAGNSTWTRTYSLGNGSTGRSVCQTADGGYAVAGSIKLTGGTGYPDILLLKTDPAGDTLWHRSWGFSGWDQGNSIYQTTDGGYIIAAETESLSQYDVYLIKTNAIGNIVVDEQKSDGKRASPGMRIYAQPNPFRYTTKICIGHRAKSIEMKIYDITGKLVKVILPTTYSLLPTVVWDGTDQTNCSVPMGIYFIRVEVDGQPVMKKIVKTR